MGIFYRDDFYEFEEIGGVSAEEIEFMKNNINKDKNEILVLCAKKGFLKASQFLVENGADVRFCNGMALVKSAQNGHLEMVKYLVKKGVNIHIDGDRALRCSAEEGHLEIVKYLVKVIFY